MFSIIAIPSGFVASTTEVMGQVFSDLSGIIGLILGVVLGMFAIGFLVNVFHK